MWPSPPHRADALRPLRARYCAEYRNHSAPLRLPWVSGAHHRTGGLSASDRAFRRAGMDYLDQVSSCGTPPGRPSRLGGAAKGCGSCCSRRAPPLLSRSPLPGGRLLLFGRESSGVPEAVHAAADARLRSRWVPALAQCRDGLRDGGGRGAAAGRRVSILSPRA